MSLRSPLGRVLGTGSAKEGNTRWWAERLSEWDAAAKDAFVYFNNDGHGNAVRNGVALRQLLSC